jgi:hypothetical protein
MTELYTDTVDTRLKKQKQLSPSPVNPLLVKDVIYHRGEKGRGEIGGVYLPS